MSTNASTSAGLSVDTSDYDRMLETLDVAIEEAVEKIQNGRINSPEHEKTRCKQWRTLAYMINVRRQVANDRDLEEVGQKVEQLQQRFEGEL